MIQPYMTTRTKKNHWQDNWTDLQNKSKKIRANKW